MKKLIILAIALSTTLALQAQYKGGLWNYTWDISLGMGDTKDFIGKASFRGFTIGGKGFVSENIALGGQASWHTFYEKEFTTEEFDIVNDGGERVTGAINGTQLKYINSFPLLFTTHYFTKSPVFETFSLFGGVGVGTSIITRRLDIGVVSLQENKWHFTVAPEVGFVYGFNSSVKALVSAQYFHSFKTNDTPQHQHLTFHIGLASTF